MRVDKEIKPVFGLTDLQEAAPIFHQKWAAAIGSRLMKWLNID